MALGRELTKTHEELVVRPISTHLSLIGEGRGEYTLVVQPANVEASHATVPSPGAMHTEFGCLIENENLSRRGAIKHLAVKYGLKARDVYALVEQGALIC